MFVFVLRTIPGFNLPSARGARGNCRLPASAGSFPRHAYNSAGQVPIDTYDVRWG